jgi:secondary thiamine-phosphate synthase enzyme
LTTADLDPGTDKDLLEAVRKIFPEGDYRHPHNPDHVGDHIMSSIIGPSVLVPVKKGELKLGTWQRVVLVELNGRRERTITLNFISSR